MRYPSIPNRLETERLVLRAEQLDDAKWFVQLLNERGAGVFTLDDARQRIAMMKDLVSSIGIGALTVTVKPDLDPIGYCAIIIGRR